MNKIFLTIALLALITSCCKEGVNGDATVVVFARHHGNIIKNHVGYPDTVYVKFNTKDLPGLSPSDYDYSFAGEEGEDHIHCEKLKCGDYFFFVTGFDSTINTRVTGGMHVKIKHKEKKDEMDVDVAVTE